MSHVAAAAEPIRNIPATEGLSVDGIAGLIEETSGWIAPTRDRLRSTVIGQQHMTERLLHALLVGGHLLIEGPPGVGKTLAVKTLAQLIAADRRRIQFMQDMESITVPGDLPLNTSLLLADEINRAPARVLSVLLEAMEEQQITIGTASHPLPELFLVCATQSPFGHEGTFPLPEALLDRFMFHVFVSFPSPENQRLIIDRDGDVPASADPLPMAKQEQIIASRSICRAVYVDDKIKDYLVAIICASRDPEAYGLDLSPYIESGASTRAAIQLKQAAQAMAYMSGRGFVTPDDVKQVAVDVLHHRIHTSFEADAALLTSTDLVRTILDTIPIP